MNDSHQLPSGFMTVKMRPQQNNHIWRSICSKGLLLCRTSTNNDICGQTTDHWEFLDTSRPSVGPCRVAIVRIMQHGIIAAVITDRVIITTHLNKAMEESSEFHNKKVEDRQRKWKQTSSASNTNRQDVVERTLDSLETATVTRYVIPCYDYCKDVDTTRPAKNISQNFRNAYGWRVHEQQSMLTS